MVKASPAYAGMDIDRIHSKFVLWCSNKNKNPSRARFLNWLNREEQPMTAGDLTPTSEGDEMRKRTAQQELEAALRNERNRKMPDLSTEAKKLFFTLKTHWLDLQHKVVTGQNIFSDSAAPVPVPVKNEPKKQDDYKSMAAGDREEEEHGG